MLERNRRKRAVLRDRRRGAGAWWPILGPITGFDLYLHAIYAAPPERPAPIWLEYPAGRLAPRA
jgi:hypothetical protein